MGLRINVSSNREELGRVAAGTIAEALRAKLADNHSVSVLFASAPSQTETLTSLSQLQDLSWERVTAFHLDEYAGAPEDAWHSFRRYLAEHLLSKVAIRRFEGLRGEAQDLQLECARYAALLERNPPDIALIGVGENGHLAFNDPPEARFEDSNRVRVVELTESCRKQQVHDGTFSQLEEVPASALTITIPEICRVPELFVMVPGRRKAEAIRAAIESPISEECLASILRTHPKTTLFLDSESACLLSERM